MKRTSSALFIAFVLSSIASQAQVTFGQSVVPLYVEGVSPTNNNRTPFWFWGEITGLTPGSTYHYYTALDSANASTTSNGSGNPLLVNMTTGVVRRSPGASMSNVTGYDSIVAGSTGNYAGWFGVEPVGNGRYTPGNTLYPKIMLNNGAGGTSIASRVLFINDPVTVLKYDTVSFSTTQGSALYDSVNAPAKNFVALYNNVTLPARPLSFAIVENDAMDLYSITSYAGFYRNLVDTITGYYGTIIPNFNADGIRYLEVRDFNSGLQTALYADDNGIWCSGLDTRNPHWGNTGMNLVSTFTLTGSATIPDTTWTGQSTFFTATSNSSNTTYTWDFGDAGTGTGANPVHTYNNPGTVQVQLIIGTGGCSDTIYHTVVVELGTFIADVPTLWFGVAPNPSQGEFMITTKDMNRKTVTVLNLVGETITTQTYSGNTLMLDLKGEQNGIYFIRIKDEQTGRSGLKKVVLQ